MATDEFLQRDTIKKIITEVRQFIEETTQKVDEYQQKVLAEILSQNAETEYLSRYRLNGAIDRKSFKAKIPLVSYEDVRPDIERLANGDPTPVLSGQPITDFYISRGISAGISGAENKLFPCVKGDLERRQFYITLIKALIFSHLPVTIDGKGLHFFFQKPDKMTAGGLRATSLTTALYKMSITLICPEAVLFCPDSFDSIYTQLLCGLLQRHQITRIGASWSYGLNRAIRFFQLHWQLLTADIESGTLNPKIKNTNVREAMSALLKPDPELAQSITAECRDGNWEGIIIRIWPNTEFLITIVTGDMQTHLPTLEMLSGRIPIISMDYITCQASMGINLNPLCKPSEVSYTLLPSVAYFEFIPHDSSYSSTGPPSRLVDLADLELDKEYEVVVTTHAGLNRYRIGDILRVTGFHNAAPEFKFVKGKSLLQPPGQIKLEELGEADLTMAVKYASKLLRKYGASVVEFTSFLDKNTLAAGHYIIYWEIAVKESGREPSHRALDKCSLAMKDAMTSVPGMSQPRDDSAGLVEIRVVMPGTFQKLLESWKLKAVPKIQISSALLEMLDSRVLSTHVSKTKSSK